MRLKDMRLKADHAVLCCVVLAVATAVWLAFDLPDARVRGEASQVAAGALDSGLPAASFTNTRVGLKCKSGDCVFGLYTISGAAAGGAVSVQLSSHLSGAVFRVTYRGVDFVNPVAIVGGSMQTALVYDGKGQYNPTEAGAGNLDSFTGKSSSKLLSLRGNGRAAYTSTQAAYFNEPGKVSKGIMTGNRTVLSDTVMSKRLEFVGDGACDYTIQVRNPANRHYFSLLEVLCCWTPRAACRQMQVLVGGAWQTAPDTLKLYFVPNARGLAMSTADGGTAMGVKLLSYPSGGRWEAPRYGTPQSNAVWRKWSITQRINPNKDQSFRIPGTPFTWRIRLFFGTLASVKTAIAAA
jgi:hypothetical protein